LDEEGLIYDENVYSNTRGSKHLLDTLDCVFLWGDNQKKTVEKISEIKINKYTVGSPKFDIYNLFCLSSRIQDRREGEKVKILINTRFTYVNSLLKGDEQSVLRNLGFIKNKKDEVNFLQFLSDDKLIFQEFEKLIKLLSKSNNFELVIRPHPAEDFDFYKNYEFMSSNIIVDNATSLIEQMAICDIVIHDGCTTAIEARAMGIPVFGLRPTDLKNPYNAYANAYSHNFESGESLYKYLVKSLPRDRLLKKSFGLMPDVDRNASSFINNWLGKSSASDRIVSVVSNFYLPDQKIINRFSSLTSLFSSYNVKGYLRSLILHRSIVSKFFKKLFSEKRVESFKLKGQIKETKFPNLSISNVRQELEFLCSIDGSLGHSSLFVTKKLTSDSFLIYAKSDESLKNG
jgi:surface carbohydrate biosynthesis protein